MVTLPMIFVQLEGFLVSFQNVQPVLSFSYAFSFMLYFRVNLFSLWVFNERFCFLLKKNYKGIPINNNELEKEILELS